MVKRLVIGLFSALLLLPVPGLATQENSLFISAERLSTIYKNASVVVADVRPESVFARRHVPGSINIQAFALVGKKIFYGKDMVILGDGLAACQLLDLRKRMLASGFAHVRILSGGIDAWDAKADMTPCSVKSFLLRAANTCKDISPLVIDLRSSAEYAKRHIEGSVSVPFVPFFRDEKKFLARLKRIKPFFKGAGQQPDAPLIFVSGAEAVSIEAAAWLKQNKYPFSYYLSGGIMAWYLEKDYPKGTVVVGPGTNGCASCPKTP